VKATTTTTTACAPARGMRRHARRRRRAIIRLLVFHGLLYEAGAVVNSAQRGQPQDEHMLGTEGGEQA